MTDKRLQERNLNALVRNGGFQFTNTFFPYTSGQIGPYYVQSIAVENSGSDYQMACMGMTDLVHQGGGDWPFEVISGGESRDWDFSNVVAYILGMPHAKIYKNGKILGANLKGKRVAHVADLNNEGSSVRDLWVPAIREAGGRIEDIFFYVDRLEDGVQVMEELGLRSDSVVPLDDHAWSYLLEQEVISPEVYESLKARMEDKDVWARNMLRSDAGFETLVNLIKDPKTLPKAQKILFKGYPDLKNEFLRRLSERDGRLGGYVIWDPSGGFM
jgi:orotate phosphoribosyltransferase